MPRDGDVVGVDDRVTMVVRKADGEIIHVYRVRKSYNTEDAPPPPPGATMAVTGSAPPGR